MNSTAVLSEMNDSNVKKLEARSRSETKRYWLRKNNQKQ